MPPAIEGAALLNMGIIQLEIGRPTLAVALFTEGMALGRRTGQDFVVANALLNSASAHLELGALAAFETLGSTVDHAETLTHLAAVHRDAGRRNQAADTAGRALEAARTLDAVRVLGEERARAALAEITAELPPASSASRSGRS